VGGGPGAADSRLVKVGYVIGVFLVASALALPAGAAAGQGGQVPSLAAQQCAQERATVGKKAFRKRYGQKRTMRSCVRRNRARVAAVVGTAAEDCQAELSGLGETDFIDEYADLGLDSVDTAMNECIAEGVDQLLNPDDYVDDDGTDDEE
jgi:hypothetical protein